MLTARHAGESAGSRERWRGVSEAVPGPESAGLGRGWVRLTQATGKGESPWKIALELGHCTTSARLLKALSNLFVHGVELVSEGQGLREYCLYYLPANIRVLENIPKRRNFRKRDNQNYYDYVSRHHIGIRS